MSEFVKQHRNPEDPTDVFYKDGSVDYSRVQGNNPLSGGEYPKALYRAGGSEKIHGHMVDMITVGSDAEEEAYAAEGWRPTPDKAAKFGKSLVDEPPAQDPRDAEIERLRALLEAQSGGEPKADDMTFVGTETSSGFPETGRRGPGRPRKEQVASQPE